MKKYDQLIFEGLNPTNSNSESTQNSHIYKSTEEISGKKPKFLILRNNTKHKCSKCGSVDDTMYVLGNVFCKKCLPYKPYSVRKKRNLNGEYLKYGSITKELTEDNLIDLYHHQKKSLQDIAKGCKCSRQMVKSLMERYGIPRRNRSRARLLAIKEGKFERFEYDDIDEDFFSKWTPQMAWVLGLLFTDGYIMEEGTGLRVARGLQVKLDSIDLDMLEDVRRHLKSTRLIQKKVQSYDRTKHIYSFVFYRERMRNDLISLGLLQRKSLTMRFPDVPDKFMRHFIRGCWDGDGTVYLTGGKIDAQYCGGSKKFIERLVEELFKVGICRTKTSFLPLRIYENHRSKNISYSIKLNSKGNIEKLFHYFYDEVDESMYLSRKYEVFVKGLELKDAPN